MPRKKMKQIPAWIFKVYIFAYFVPGFRALTPPRILYGGWTPIIPGHPFYFGPVKPPEQPQYQTHHHVHYGEPALTHLPEHEVEHHEEYVRPEQFQSYDKHQEVYPATHENKLPEKDRPQITYGHHPHKDIFSYYPPQSTYDEPKEPQLKYKPVYFEIPRPPLDILKNAHIASLKDLPIDLKSIHPVNGQASLKMKPVNGNINLNVLKHIGHINAGQLHYLVPDAKYPVIKDSSGGIPSGHINADQLHYLVPDAKYPVIKYSSGGIPRKPASLSYNYKNPEPIHALYGLKHVPKSALNSYEGIANGEVKYSPLKRPLNPIETKYFRNPHLMKSKPDIHVPKLSGYKHLNLPVVSPNLYQTSHKPYSGPRYLPLVKQPGFQSAVHHSKNTATKNYVVPPHHSVRPFVPSKSAYLNPTLGYPSNLLKDYLHKDVKLQSLYKNPAVVTNIRGSPALIEREVAIIHVPVTNSHELRNSEYLFHTASTPESTQILGVSNLNESVPFAILNKHIPVMNDNESYTHIALDFGKDLEHVTLVEPSVNSQIDPPVEKAYNDGQSPNQYQYIFVSSNGIHGTDQYNAVDQANEESYPHSPTDGRKQYFHAYYGSPDHVPPPGYVKMTVVEFNKLFRNAEIRYVDKDLETESSVKKEYHKPVDLKTS